MLHEPDVPLVLNIECPNEITFDRPGQSKAVPLQTEEPMGGLPDVSTTVHTNHYCTQYMLLSLNLILSISLANNMHIITATAIS